MTDLNNKTVFITGASQGIGEAIARLFAQQKANVVLFARNQENLKNLEQDIQENGGNALAIAGDVADFSSLQNAVNQAHAHFGSLDVLINNAGVIQPIADLADCDVNVWSNGVDVNLKGVFYGLRAALPHMIKNGAGTVINISSGAASYAMEGWSQYCASKAGVLSLTRSAHAEYANNNICVVGLSPGTVATQMQTDIRKSGVNPVSKLDWSAHIPPEWVAKAAVYLSGEGGKEFAGSDFSLKTNEGRARLGLPTVS